MHTFFYINMGNTVIAFDINDFLFSSSIQDQESIFTNRPYDRGSIFFFSDQNYYFFFTFCETFRASRGVSTLFLNYTDIFCVICARGKNGVDGVGSSTHRVIRLSEATE